MNTQMMREAGANRPAGLIATSDVVRTLTVVSSLRANQPGTSKYSEFQTQQNMAKENARQLQQVIDLIPLQMFILEPESSASFENQAAREYFGPLQAASPKERMIEVTHSDDMEGVVGAYENALSSGQPFEAEARLRGKDGSYRWFLQHMYPLRDELGRIVRWCGTRIDVHDKKQSHEDARRESLALREEIDRTSMFEEIVGTSPALKAALARIAKVAPTDSTVLITGETGTGKELVARAIHKRSSRAKRPFVSVNCAAIPKDLIASELFGHEKGAFTGALQQRLGRFEMAEGGTIFLDEIGELPAETQIALLRILQEYEFERVGGARSIRADVRVIAATNRDLQLAIAAGTFRSDLFYRLNVFPIEIPSLRERREDIPLLAEYFIDRYARKAGKSFRAVNRKTLDLLQAYSWAGNIRELQNVIERSVIVCDTEEFSVDESWLSRSPLGTERKSQVDLSRRLATQEKEMIEAALRESGGRVSGRSGAAAKLGIPGSTLETKIRSLKIDKYRFKPAVSSPGRIK